MSESYAFIAAILCGVGAALLWHAFGALRITLGSGAITDGVLDLVWWVTIAVAFSICMWQFTALRIRFFEFLGVGIGGIFTHFALGRVLDYVFGIVFAVFLKIIRFIFKILLTPWTFLYKILIVGIFGKFKKGTKNGTPKK